MTINRGLSARGLALAVSTMMTLHGGATSAQEADPASTNRLRLGPVNISPTITLRDLGVDLNVYNEAQNRDQDFAFTVVPEFIATIGRRRSLTMRSTTELVYYAEQHSERSVNENVSGVARAALGKFVPFTEFGYLTTRERLNEEIDTRASRVEKRGALGVQIALTPKLSAAARADLSRMAFAETARFDDLFLAQELDRETRAVAGSVRYVATPLTAIVVTTEASAIRFAQSSRDTDSLQTYLTLELNPRALISGSARLGIQGFHSRARNVPDFTGLVGSANLTYRFQPSTSVGFLFDRDVSFSYLPLEPYYVRDRFGLSAQRQVVSQWYITVSGERSWYRYRRSGVGPGEAAGGRSDRLLGGSILIGYDLGRRSRFTADLSYQERQSEFAGRGYEGLRFGTTVTYGF